MCDDVALIDRDADDAPDVRRERGPELVEAAEGMRQKSERAQIVENARRPIAARTDAPPDLANARREAGRPMACPRCARPVDRAAEPCIGATGAGENR